MIFAFSKTDVSEMLRERTRCVIVKGESDIVMYTQPDFVNYEDFYEMKSFEISEPVQPEVLFQVRLFQLAFDGNANILGFIEENGYYNAQIIQVPPLEDTERQKLLNEIYLFGISNGKIAEDDQYLMREYRVYRYEDPEKAGS